MNDPNPYRAPAEVDGPESESEEERRLTSQAVMLTIVVASAASLAIGIWVTSSPVFRPFQIPAMGIAFVTITVGMLRWINPDD